MTPPISAAPAEATAAPLAFDPDLVRKYDQSGPRYTSYPTADRFHEAFGPADYVQALLARRETRPHDALSLYVHVPFCNTLCYYCACNKVITRDHGRSAKYIRYVAREIDIVSSILEPESTRAPVAQLHLGGGTPTFLARDEMSALVGHLRGAFPFAPDAEVSIEVDPRKVDTGTIEFLGSLGFNRISVGVQDFDPVVQKAVNRVQSEAETRAVIEAARANGFVSVNTDLIYGLPRQTLAGFSATLDRVVDISPDRIALYSYAHVPHLFKPQRRILVEELPPPEEKLAILALAIGKLGAAGYVYIGMDHFAKPGDELARAQRDRKLHRNFQGYSTKPDCDLLAFGISAIGKVGRTYVQNVRTLDEYYDRLDARALPALRGYALTDDDLVRRDAIGRLMCDFDLSIPDFEARHGVVFPRAFAAELVALAPLAADGLVEVTPSLIRVTERGRLLVRTVAMVFDRHLREARAAARYSRVI
ncbi:oxygen-independent coproporphyrinogen III oxidase [Burkholderiales bacterium]|nr:oxygen-independent coproporphyrinogen III oxidase [Burkholderiales bacterium]